jgi:uncharacterized protein (TIGR03067 family)
VRALAILMLIASPGFAAPVPKELKKTDADRIVGLWTLTGSCNGGGNVNPADGSSWKFEAGGKASIIQRGGAPRGDIKYAVDPSGDSKAFDWIAPWGEWYGVYTLDGDSLTIYISSGKGKAGRNLKANTGPGIEMYSFKRAPETK